MQESFHGKETGIFRDFEDEESARRIYTIWNFPRKIMNATPEEIAHYEKLAMERGGSVGRAIKDGVIVRAPGGPATADLPIKLTEEAFQSLVIDMAHAAGWKVAHFRPARTSKGWRTAVSGDGKGLPDLILVRERVVWAELKAVTKKMTNEQIDWAVWLLDANQEWYCWDPKDMDEIKKVLA